MAEREIDREVGLPTGRWVGSIKHILASVNLGVQIILTIKVVSTRLLNNYWTIYLCFHLILKKGVFSIHDIIVPLIVIFFP